MITVTLAVAIALVFTRATVVLFAALLVALFWGYVVVSTDPMQRWRRGDDPAVSQSDHWRDRDL
jgi:hypothetical protein